MLSSEFVVTDRTGGQSRGSKPPRWLCSEAQDALSPVHPGCTALVAADHGAKRGWLVLPRGSAGWTSGPRPAVPGLWLLARAKRGNGECCRLPVGPRSLASAKCIQAARAATWSSLHRPARLRAGMWQRPGCGRPGCGRPGSPRCLFTRGGTGPCQPPACTQVLFR